MSDTVLVIAGTTAQYRLWKSCHPRFHPCRHIMFGDDIPGYTNPKVALVGSWVELPQFGDLWDMLQECHGEVEVVYEDQ